MDDRTLNNPLMVETLALQAKQGYGVDNDNDYFYGK